MFKCKLEPTCPGSEPFYVGLNNPRFRYSNNGYLPSQCDGCFYYEPNEIILGVPSRPKAPSKVYDQLEQLRLEVIGWRKKHAELQLAVDRLTPIKKKATDTGIVPL